MSFTSLLTLLFSAAAGASPISAEFVDWSFNDADNAIFERYDVRLTNTAGEEATLSLCPPDSRLLVAEPVGRSGTRTRTTGMTASALALDGSAWDFDCVDRVLAAGESATVSIYFRSWVNNWNRRFGRSVVLSTSLGEFFVREGEVTLLAAADEG